MSVDAGKASCCGSSEEQPEGEGGRVGGWEVGGRIDR